MLKKEGFDVVHTKNLPNKERIADNEIRIIAKEKNSICNY